MTDTLSKYYVHSVDVSEQLRDELTFSDPERIRMYSDNERLGVRLRPTKYNQSAEKPEFPNSALRFDNLYQSKRWPDKGGFCRLSYDANRKVLVLTISTDTVKVNPISTWEFDGNDWKQVLTPTVLNIWAGWQTVYHPIRKTVLLLGGSGYDENSNPIDNEFVWEYDGTDWVKLETATVLPSLVAPGVAYDSARNLVVVQGGAHLGSPVNDTWVYDGTDWTQVVTATSPPVIYLHGMTFDSARGVTVSWGGFVGWTPNTETWEFDGTDWTHIVTATTPTAGIVPALEYDTGRGVCVMMGAVPPSPVTPQETWEYNGTDWTQVVTATGSPAQPRHWNGIAYNSDEGFIYIFGGIYDNPALTIQWFNDFFRYDPVSGTWIEYPDYFVKPSERFWSDIVYDSYRKVHVLYGGADAFFGVAFNDTWEFDPATNRWTQVSPPANPGMRAGHRMVFDTVNNVVILYGGYDGLNFKDETWSYDGFTWKQLFTAQSPGGRLDPAMVWDPDRERIVLFGGEGPAFGDNNNDIWEYTPGTWTRVSTAHSPQVRRWPRMDYDKHRKVMVLFGGIDPDVGSWPGFRDTWEYNGTDWNRIETENAPGPRVWHGQFYDEVLQIVVVYAGYNTEAAGNQPMGFDWDFNAYYKDVWGYDGQSWFRLEGIDIRENMTVDYESYDTDLCKALLWFGTDSYGEFFNETYWLEFTNTDLTCRLPVWSPQAVKGWNGFEEVSERSPGLLVHWRVSDGSSDYWFNGTAWVVASLGSEWNTDLEVSANLQSFPFAQKKIQLVCRLVSASRWETPVVLGTRLLMTASFDWFEDLVLRSLVPRIEEDFAFLMDWSGVLEAGSDRFNIKTDYPFIPEEDLNVIGIESVFNDDTDPDHNIDLLQSFDPNTGEAILTGTLPAGTRLFYRLNVAPEVAVNYTNTDYDEIGKTPTIIIDQIRFEGRQVEAFADMALKDRLEGAKLSAPLWIEVMRVQCALITGKIVSALRLMTKAYAFVVRGATQQPGHKPGAILKTRALDLEHTLKIVPVSRYNPKPQFSDLKEATFEYNICDFYAWLRDMEQTDLVTRFNPSVADMRNAGTGNPDNKLNPLPAGAIPTLYRTPEVEEV